MEDFRIEIKSNSVLHRNTIGLVEKCKHHCAVCFYLKNRSSSILMYVFIGNPCLFQYGGAVDVSLQRANAFSRVSIPVCLLIYMGCMLITKGDQILYTSTYLPFTTLFFKSTRFLARTPLPHFRSKARGTRMTSF